MIVSDLTQRFLLTKHLPWCATLSASSRALVAAAPSETWQSGTVNPIRSSLRCCRAHMPDRGQACRSSA